MGRRKISIKQISDPKLRHITFNKRKNGLIKKAAELSLLCNVNMLLVFEDGNGSLIQFSRDKIANLGQFFKDCRYSSLLELSSNDYPNFFKVNHYKKAKEKEKEQMIVDVSNVKKHKHGRTYSQFSEGETATFEEANNSDKTSGKDQFITEYKPAPLVNSNKETPKGVAILPSNLSMTENTTSPKSEDANIHKKIKNKLGLKLQIQKDDDKLNLGPGSLIRSTPPKLTPRALAEQIQEQMRLPMDRTPMEILQSPFFSDHLQQLGLLESSPFKFYNANSKTRFLHRLNSGTEDLSAILKGSSSYIFPVGGITPMLKSAVPTDFDDKLLDTAKIASLLSETNRIFNFQTEQMKEEELQHLDKNNLQRQDSKAIVEEKEPPNGKISDLGEVKKKIKDH